jgi:hypothetical protein
VKLLLKKIATFRSFYPQVMTEPKVVKIESDGHDIFVVVDGGKIAKRSHPDTPQAKTWVSLEPGWVVLDGPALTDPDEESSYVEISHHGVRVH